MLMYARNFDLINLEINLHNFLFNFYSLALSEEFQEGDFNLIERFIVLMYDRGSACTDVNTCRRILFTSKNKDVESIPPTQDALKQHLLPRAMLQAM